MARSGCVIDGEGMVNVVLKGILKIHIESVDFFHICSAWSIGAIYHFDMFRAL
jgi:hypothetical protein